MTRGRAPGVSSHPALALIRDGFDAQTARSAVISLAVAALAAASPALVRPEAASHDLLLDGLLLIGAAALFVLRRRLPTRTVGRRVTAAGGLLALASTKGWLAESLHRVLAEPTTA